MTPLIKCLALLIGLLFIFLILFLTKEEEKKRNDFDRFMGRGGSTSSSGPPASSFNDTNKKNDLLEPESKAEAFKRLLEQLQTKNKKNAIIKKVSDANSEHEARIPDTNIKDTSMSFKGCAPCHLL